MDLIKLKKMADSIRALSIDSIVKAKSGHPGLPLGMADVATVLSSFFLKIDPTNPSWINRDRFILSAGHGSMLLYSILHLLGYEDYDIDTLKNFRQKGSRASGHPENIVSKVIETTSGPLGQGFANAVGMAIAEKLLSAKFNNIIDHYTYALVSDGCLMEGISHETASFAGHLQLNKLIVLFDNNNVSIDGDISLVSSEQVIERFVSYGWYVEEVDGHNYEEIYEAINNARNSNLPSFISCKTIIGKYLGSLAGKSSSHSWPIDENTLSIFKENIGYLDNNFNISEETYRFWEEISIKNRLKYDDWKIKFDKLSSDKKIELNKYLNREIDSKVFDKLNELKINNSSYELNSTRKYSGFVLSEIFHLIPNLLGGSADLSSSNCTYVKGMKILKNDGNDNDINYIHYGIREHFMSACVNGIVLYGGFIPYAGTFFIFSDYCRPAIRMSALMKIPAIYIMTHDSIGVGEDGPTHQPVEHLAVFRSMPNINIYRPADLIETIESWSMILKTNDKPSLLILSRQKIQFYKEDKQNLSNLSRGAYIISESKNKNFKFTFLSSGTELSIALELQKKLLVKEGIFSRVISVPCMDIFDIQDQSYKDELLDNDSIKISIEAGVKDCWYKYIGTQGIHFGINDFGISAPSDQVFEYFKLTTHHIYNSCINLIK